ncbi:MAG: toll/interleukin-1 receptor domain-containing protein [Planctomycetes bacterium]|nr:toll/interleukin-1 receptor domain-containing protein [Planctomycetota bacterium]
MRVFISYSVADIDLLQHVVRMIHASGDQPLCWQVSKEPGKEAWKSIFEWIDSSDLVIVIITDKTVKRAMSVGQEVGHARAVGKPILPLVAPIVQPSDLGCLSGVVFQQIQRENPVPALRVVNRVIRRMKQRQASEMRRIVVLAGALVTTWLLGESARTRRRRTITKTYR